uniref:Seminal vesicle secretory protein 6 n=1 Tax=Mus musculus TaxID=10090 RepID=SVS6_MOUSE|nr:RecName: Full=Seminal vesicle secretory protein 6; AltName: Full=SVSP99; AltName: Full=Seminal vesicle protein 6; AltName: Full=Seminal vesicle secretory protein VI; Short=SVS VI; Flags: Precursor [Mus musculus]pir/I56445/ MSVSP 99 - mouse [Mus sp.]AAA40157.1 androgen regulated; putative [Mus musculus]AAB28235.1 MSVSP 99 [Mus sp.]AAC15243.1 SVSP99 [Mus musculus]AAI19248.1 Seminal vesicle secretory protein 6 [Mus musculus]AAI19250.1 Seminal vesicle secretory protein 6 [Mus musculus]
MSPTSFFLLTMLLVLVTETAAKRPRERFSQAIEEFSSESSEANSPKSIVHEEVYEEKKFKRNMVNGEDGEDSKRASAGEIERSYLRKKEKQRFAQEMDK